jgi:hypothetical protein
MFTLRFWLASVISLSPILFNCTGESFDFCKNPIGSATIQRSHNGYICFQEDFNGCFRVEFTPSDYGFNCVLFTGHPIYGNIADVGAVECLGAITAKPASSEYALRKPIIEGHGYIMWLSDGTYGRFYVDSITGSGSNLTVNIIFQYSF